MERDKKLRSVTRTRFTKVVNILDPEISKTNADLGVITDKFSKLKDIDFKLKGLDQKMLDHMMVADAEEDTLNCEIEEAEHYSDTFITLERKVRELIDSDNKSDVKSLGSSNGSSMAKSYKFPKFEIRKFDGELINWLPFWAQFERIHEDNELHDADKFHYLVQSMQSNTRARELIESYPQTADNYAKAVQALKQRYGQKYLLVEIYLRELLKLMMANVRTPPDERRSVAKLYDKLETQLRSLESLGVDTKENTTWLFPMIESCLPEDVLVAWQRSPLNNCDASKNSNSNSSSRLNNLLDFLRREVEGEERRLLARRGFEGFSPKEKLRNKFKQNSNIPTAAGLFSAKEMGCLFCENNHQSKDCITAQSMPFKDKRAKIYGKRCCLKCLKPGHLAKACKRAVQCNICAKGHYVLLCPDLPCNRKEKTHVSEVVQSALANQQCTRDVTLMTLMVNIMGNNGYRRVRALLDPGSQKSYILESTALEVKLKPIGNVNIAHSLFGGTQTETKCHKVYTVALCSNLSELDTLRQFEFLGQDIICGEIPRTPRGAWLNELKGSRIWLSDLGRDSPKIELLIGSDIYGSLLSGRVKQLKNGLTAIETHLGWTICGPSPKKDEQSDCSSLVVISMHSRNMSVDYLWDLETIGIKDPRENLSKLEEDKIVHQHFLNTVHQQEDGRCCVGLPWLGNQEGIPSNRHIVERRLFNTTRKLRAKCIFSEYDRVFQEWLAEGVIEKVSPEDLNRKCHFLPHDPVVKANSNTTKIRPVFDASCKDKGNLSLNDCLASGPNVIEQIPSILLKFREKAIGVIADIRKAFLKIEVKEEDGDYLRFLWWKNNHQIQVFRLKRVVFGVTCSPYLLGAVILHHLKGVSSEFGALPQKLMECLYIDNCVTSVDTEAELVDLVEKSTEIFAKAKMDLRMWQFGPIHRAKEVYSRLPPSVDIERSEEASVLGMKWDLLEDTLNMTPKFGVIINSLSKRDLLSHTQQIFDPIGFLAPVLLPAKLLIQQAWTVKTDWDEPLPSTIQENFMKWYSELDTLADIKIPRRVGHGIRAHWSIHIFCDDSQSAYAAAAFLRCPENKGVSVQLLMTKSRLGPLKKTTIPRMELLACMLGVRLSRYITESLNLAAEPVYYWTDSTTALSWIKTNRQWGTFVNNRVKEICNTSGPNKWFYVPGSLNPADLPSRGCSVLQLKRTRWWEGPEWLKQPQDHWPKQLFHSDRTLVNFQIDLVTGAELAPCLFNGKVRFQNLSGPTACGSKLGWLLTENFMEKKTSEPLLDYRLLTVTYGLSCAPYLAMRTLHQLARDKVSTSPVASKIVQTDFYVDDLLSGADTIEEATCHIREVNNLLSSAGFSLRKWRSNVPEVLSGFSEQVEDRHNLRDFESDSCVKILDCASRGITPSELVDHSLWWRGPTWLSDVNFEDPIQTQYDFPKEISGERGKPFSVFHSTNVLFPDFIFKYSNINELVRITAWIYRFVFNVQCSFNERKKGHLSSSELTSSIHNIIRFIQSSEFQSEITCCKQKKSLSTNSYLIPFIDESGLLRVGGRLRHLNLQFDKKHPIIFPRDHFITELIVRQCHLDYLHSGLQLTMSAPRLRYWIPAGRSLVKKIIHQCMVCFRAKRQGTKQIMGDLPMHQIVKSNPFTKIGIDFAGPFLMKPNIKRSKVKLKSFFALFVCFCTKAIHIEIVSDLSSAAFLAALKRFISRRGKPSDIFSDNGTNFRGANNILREQFGILKAPSIQNFISNERINCHFIPPYAPNFGESNDDDDVPINCLDRWSLNIKNKNVFWKRWNREYLNNLQQHLKWQKSSPIIKEGDLILLKDTISPLAMYFSLGRITKVFPGADGKVRVVEVKTKHQERLTRTASKIVPLPFAED
ncbi:hypothetical protein LAZ67_1001682 [Cordylochernes scorpioides]|uniref:Pro-Pol polyprotein n=1 Tax=Cordylochernes scorpioides TaxID=51811 RepID=A0ABY6JVM6_9ARAC|nr:hypothetical protein LAZ67_1001682 [Cordylochernes scorpioides]